MIAFEMYDFARIWYCKCKIFEKRKKGREVKCCRYTCMAVFGYLH